MLARGYYTACKRQGVAINRFFSSMINFIKSKSGEKTGKAILHFQSEKEAKNAIKIHQGRAVLDSHLFLELYEANTTEEQTKKSEGDKSFQQRLLSRVYVRNISKAATKDDIIAITSKIADVEEIKFPKYEDGKHMGFAIVYLKNPDHVSKLINSLDNQTLIDKQLSVSMKLEPVRIEASSKLSSYSNYVQYIKRKYMSTQKEINLENSYIIKSGVKYLLEPYKFETDRREVYKQIMRSEDKKLMAWCELSLLQYQRYLQTTQKQSTENKQ